MISLNINTLMTNSRILHVTFANGESIEISLIDNDFVAQWIDFHLAIKKKLNDKFLTRKPLFFYHGTQKYQEQANAVKQESVVKINQGIDALGTKFDLEFPFRAYNDMSWTETNIMHRCFTTSVINMKSWNWLGCTRSQLRDFKYYHVESAGHHANEFFKECPAEFNDHQIHKIHKNYDEFIDCLEMINKYIHVYENNSHNERSKLELDDHTLNNLVYLETEWDVYRPTGGKIYKSKKITKDMQQYCNYDPDEYDVYICKSITGKDYLQCYSEYDDPLQFDIENFGNLNGGFTIQPSKMYAKWFQTPRAKDWLRMYGVPHDPKILQPLPLGKVLTTDWFTSSFEQITQDPTRINSWGDSMLTPNGTVVRTEII